MLESTYFPSKAKLFLSFQMTQKNGERNESEFFPIVAEAFPSKKFRRYRIIPDPRQTKQTESSGPQLVGYGAFKEEVITRIKTVFAKEASADSDDAPPH